MIDTNLYLSLTDTIALLPGVKPRAARQVLKDAQVELLEASLGEPDNVLSIGQEDPATTLAGRELRLADLEGIFKEDDWGKQRVTPKGAALIADLYLRGAFPLKGKNAAPESPDQLLAYANDEAGLLARQEARNAARAAARRPIENPEEIREADFTYELLDQVIFEHCGPGSHRMTLDGIEVSKTVTRYTSNSRKTGDYKVVISWTGRDGERRVFEKPSLFENNRSNDPARNWGAGRE
ncbi:hypothetical protein AAFN88_14935 [Pelagibius sp. CAU 1746]|uniref:hypothetical protein n=1 Tax=Pelagibius sp. CAU 1746 TaxID=3140370 RepID=UPI00325B2141